MSTPSKIDLSAADVEALLERLRGVVAEDDYEIIKAMVETIAALSQAVDEKAAAIKKLLQTFFGTKTEKTAAVLEALADSVGSETEEDATPKKKPKGHGRNSAAKYTGAERVEVPLESLKHGCQCPECSKGKLYGQNAGTIVRVTGSAPLTAKVYELEKLRCNLCGKIFTATPPEGIGEKKYDESAATTIAILKYGSGLPFNRLERLQGAAGVPLPAATQWDIIQAVAGNIEPVYQELVTQAAQGEVVYNDDTTVKILELMGKRRKKAELSGTDPPSERTGIFTTGIISTVGELKMALYFSGPDHAGENLATLLARRFPELAPPIQMCDGLITRNVPKELKTILANCNAHARRKFVDVAPSFPRECQYVLEVLREVYRNDARARAEGMDPQERLEFHQSESQSLMDDLESWLEEQFTEKKVEPNSGLGEAISYMLGHWSELTLFLRQPGAPLDNNICERALKKAIINRKNALFYKTRNGAHVGDLFMSLLHTCDLSSVNPFDYLTALQKHVAAIGERPADWLPWNYKATLAALA